MKTMNLRATGVSEVMFHNIQLLDRRNKYVVEMKKITSKKKNKTGEDEDKLSYLEFCGGLYMDDDLGPVVPAISIESCIIEGAKELRKGPQAKAGIRCPSEFYKLEYKGPRTMKELYDQSFYDIRAVVVSRARIMRTRPKFKNWFFDFNIIYDEKIIGESDVISALDSAGSKKGIGEYRPRFGRFTIEELK